MSTLPLPPALTSEVADISSQPRRRPGIATLRKRLAGQGSWAIADQVVYSGGNMLVAALLSRHCAAVLFGEYILTQRAMDVLIQLSNVFLWGPYVFRLPGVDPDGRKEYLGSIVVLQVAFCAIFTLVLVVLSTIPGLKHYEGVHATFTALGFTAAGILFREFTRRLYFAQLRFQAAFLAECATVLLQVAAVLVLVNHSQATLTAVLAWLSMTATVVSAWWLVQDRQQWSVQISRVFIDFREDFKLGRWFLGSNMLFLVSAQLNPWALNGFLGGAAVADYAVTESLVNIPRVALNSMQNVMGPRIARAQQENGKEGVRRVVASLDRALLCLSVVFLIVMVSCAPWVAHTIYKRVPVNTRILTLLLGSNLVAFACSLAQSYGLTALGRVDTTVYANALGLAVQLLLCVVLTHRFGVPGAAASLLFGTLVVLAARQVHYRREMRRA